MQPLNILFITSEVTPLAKTGGLADVSAALPRELMRAGHEVRVVLPLYGRIAESGIASEPITRLQDLDISFGSRHYTFSVRRARLPVGGVPIDLVDCPALFGRPAIYTNDPDEHLRFAFLTRAAIESAQHLGWSPDVVHANDWQAGLAPLYLRSIYAWDRLFQNTRTVMTIHNLGYQGAFAAATANELGLGDAVHMLHQDDLKAGRVSFLKTGIMYADALTTVSPTYAQEIQGETLGMGLQDVLRARRDALFGILNGVDEEEWNPRIDRLIPSRYSEKSLWRKDKNKQALLESMGLPYDKGVPTIGAVSRLTAQKGFELLAGSLPGLLAERDLRFVVLGTGEPKYEDFFTRLQQQFPGKVCFYRGYSNELAHLIEAGADMFVMPSLYEPCGLNQMYSMKYGTVPIVRKTGGLADTVTPWNAATGQGTGFVFEHFTADGLRWAIEQALEAWGDRKAWQALQKNGMAADWSWTTQTGLYIELYQRLVVPQEARA
jgi:starch synthase